MKNLKRVLALVIALVFVMGTAAMAAESNDTAYAKAQDLLGQLNIMVGDENGNFNGDQGLDKGSAARIIYSLLVEMGGTLPATDTAFDDVDSTYWGSGFINALNGAQINGAAVINGNGEGGFEPYKLLSYDELNTMLSIVIGYAPYAKNYGGFPYGFKAAASKAGIYDGIFGKVEYKGAEMITRGEVAILVANTLYAEVMEANGFNSDGSVSYIFNGNVFFDVNCGLTKANGVVSALNTTAKTVNIGGKPFKIGSTDVAKMVGLNVEALAKNGTLVAVVPMGERASLASTTDAAKFTVTGNKVKVDKTEYTIGDAKITVNGTDVTKETLASFNEAAYDCFKATLYGEGTTVNEIAVEVSNIAQINDIYKATSTLKVTDKVGAKFFTIADKKDTLIVNGESVGVDAVAKNTFVTVAPKFNASLVEGFKVITVAESKLTNVAATGRKTDSKGESLYLIGDQYYALNTDFFKTAIEYDTVGTYTLDANGEVVAFEANKDAEGNKKLGYFTYYELLGGRDKGKVTFDIVIDGVKYSQTTDTTKDKKDSLAQKLYNRFDNKSNFDGKNVYVYNVGYVELDETDNVVDVAFTTVGAKDTYKYDAKLNKLDKTGTDDIYLSSTSKAYTVDKNGNIKEITLVDKTEYKDVIAYNDFANKTLEGVLIAGTSDAEDSTKYALATDNFSEIRKDGKTYTVIPALVNGEVVTVEAVAKADATDDIKKGEYFTYELGTDGTVTGIAKVAGKDGFAFNAKAVSMTVRNPKFNGAKDGYAIITKKDGVQLTYTTNAIAKDGTVTGENTVDIANGTPIYIYDVANNTFAPATAEDIYASEIVLNGATVTDAVFNTMYVNYDETDKEIAEIIFFTNWK